ncbi:protein of unknown function [Kyrpidia spormannii]|uniref:Uncharacterized protein n=2 Tax=Kyrpidia spormannii TaxID=2055160 RepID=A0ACA8ZB23_9BACL|nr:protein of unknown function [Kyrpidia spormannii]CAB3394705.1 protein of unknown function [Kyrpidia spormannii]
MTTHRVHVESPFKADLMPSQACGTYAIHHGGKLVHHADTREPGESNTKTRPGMRS